MNIANRFPALRTFGVPVPTMSAAALWALNMANQVGIISRDLVRVETVPGERKADFLGRNFVPSFITPLVMEASFRYVDTYYTIPLLFKALDLQALGYTTLPEEVRRRAVGSMVKEDSVYVIPRVLREMDVRRMQPGPEKEKMLTLIKHLEKKLNFQDYVERQVRKGQLTPAEAEQVIERTYQLLRDLKVEDYLKSLKAGEMMAPGVQHSGTSWMEKHFAHLGVDRHLAKIGDELWSGHAGKDKLVELMRRGVESKFTRGMIKRLQKTASWPKLLVSTVACTLYYGVLVNYLDVFVVKPWEDSLNAKRGTTEELVKPCYQATVPALGVLVGGMWNKTAPRLLQKMSHLNRFLVVASAATATYLGTAGLLIWKALSGPPPRNVGQKQLQAGQSRQSARPFGRPVFSLNAARVNADPPVDMPPLRPPTVPPGPVFSQAAPRYQPLPLTAGPLQSVVSAAQALSTLGGTTAASAMPASSPYPLLSAAPGMNPFQPMSSARRS